MCISLSNFKLAQMTTPEGAQQRIRRFLLLPKAEPPQDESPPVRRGHFMELGKSTTHLTPFGVGQASRELDSVPFWSTLLSHPPNPCLPHHACLSALSAWQVWFSTARPSATANQHHLAEISGPTELFQLTHDAATRAQTAERKSCLCSISVSWLIHTDLTPDLVFKCNWSTNNNVVGLVISSSVRDAQKSSGLCPFSFCQAGITNNYSVATVLTYSTAMQPLSLRHCHGKIPTPQNFSPTMGTSGRINPRKLTAVRN